MTTSARKRGKATPASTAPPKRGPAWRAAEAAGIDLSLIEASLAKTPWERLLEHDDALQLATTLNQAMDKLRAKP